MYLKIILTLTVLVAAIHSYQPANQQPPIEEDTLLEQLHRIQSRIKQKSGKSKQFGLRFSRLLQTSLKRDNSPLTLSDVAVFPSMSIPHKDNIYYSMMLRRNRDYFTMRGDLVFSAPPTHTLVHSTRNQHTYFASRHPNESMVVSRMRVANKKPVVQFQIALDLTSYAGMDFNAFTFAQMNSGKYYILGTESGRILVFDRMGNLNDELNVGQIKQMSKVSNNLVVLTATKLLYFNLNKNLSRGECLLPYGGASFFKFDEINFRYLYLRMEKVILQLELAIGCRPVKIFDVSAEAQYFLAGQLILIETVALRYAINVTDGTSNPYYLPLSGCAGESKLQVNRKSQSAYVVSEICLGEGELNLTHLLMQMQEGGVDVTDFTKFRIPLLFLSFGVIIYVTVRNKGKKTPKEEQEDRMIEEDLLRQIARMKGVGHGERELLAVAEVDGREEGVQPKRKVTGKQKRN